MKSSVTKEPQPGMHSVVCLLWPYHHSYVHMCVSPFISEFEFPRTNIKKLAIAGAAYNPCAGESGSSWSHWPAILAEWLGSGWMNICTHICRYIDDLKALLSSAFWGRGESHLTEETDSGYAVCIIFKLLPFNKMSLTIISAIESHNLFFLFLCIQYCIYS